VRKPPKEIARRLVQEARIELERVRAPRRARGFDESALLRATHSASLVELWNRLGERPFPAVADSENARACAKVSGDRARVLAAAAFAHERRVDLLGSGPYSLGNPVDWHRDIKSGHAWPVVASHRIDYADLDRPSDVKVPWELSRLHWLIPVGQAYLLDGDERRAALAKDVLTDWIVSNPYGYGVNWIVAMEAALRVLTWTWLFHVFHRTEAWSDIAFRRRFLLALFLHGDFIERNLERSDVNGNHYTADAAGLVFAGHFFGDGANPARWATQGWDILVDELSRQVHGDGVDFEASTAYHRFVTELFLLPALYRLHLGLDVPSRYASQLVNMALFAATYTRADGSSPFWGDADDARALPLGDQPLHDHRYLGGLIGSAFPAYARDAWTGGPIGEVAWLCGADAASNLPDPRPSSSRAFRFGGVYVMRGEVDHVFIDCGPVGTAGRGGHGHNDCLSFEATLDGVQLVAESGSYVYTASKEWRNRMRGTASHNTPLIDGEEQNRIDPGSLWRLANDALPELRQWQAGRDVDRFCGAHLGYRRLTDPVTPVRTIELDRRAHRLLVFDDFEGVGDHYVSIPLHLAPSCQAVEAEPGRVYVTAGARRFTVVWGEPHDWTLELGSSWISPSYGVKVAVPRLEWRRSGPLKPLRIDLAADP
jgi:uncharacterized heparinase superfamily protein